MIEGFLNDKDVEALKAECSGLVEEMNPEEHQTVFSTTKQVVYISLCEISGGLGHFILHGTTTFWLASGPKQEHLTLFFTPKQTVCIAFWEI